MFILIGASIVVMLALSSGRLFDLGGVLQDVKHEIYLPASRHLCAAATGHQPLR